MVQQLELPLKERFKVNDLPSHGKPPDGVIHASTAPQSSPKKVLVWTC